LGKRKHTLCRFNLTLFLGSFLLFSVISVHASAIHGTGDHHYILYSPKNDASSLDALQQVGEKDENETENDLEFESTIASFFFAVFQNEIRIIPFFQRFSTAEIPGNPIYLSIRNFRI
jgi:hypothetical protein